jgi:hypothetical protein
MRDFLDAVSTTATRASSVAGSLFSETAASSLYGDSRLTSPEPPPLSAVSEDGKEAASEDAREAASEDAQEAASKDAQKAASQDAQEAASAEATRESADEQQRLDAETVELAEKQEHTVEKEADYEEHSSSEEEEEDGEESPTSLDFSWTAIPGASRLSVQQIAEMEFSRPLVEGGEGERDLGAEESAVRFSFAQPLDVSMQEEEEGEEGDEIDEQAKEKKEECRAEEPAGKLFRFEPLTVGGHSEELIESEVNFQFSQPLDVSMQEVEDEESPQQQETGEKEDLLELRLAESPAKNPSERSVLAETRSNKTVGEDRSIETGNQEIRMEKTAKELSSIPPAEEPSLDAEKNTTLAQEVSSPAEDVDADEEVALTLAKEPPVTVCQPPTEPEDQPELPDMLVERASEDEKPQDLEKNMSVPHTEQEALAESLATPAGGRGTRSRKLATPPVSAKPRRRGAKANDSVSTEPSQMVTAVPPESDLPEKDSEGVGVESSGRRSRTPPKSSLEAGMAHIPPSTPKQSPRGRRGTAAQSVDMAVSMVLLDDKEATPLRRSSRKQSSAPSTPSTITAVSSLTVLSEETTSGDKLTVVPERGSKMEGVETALVTPARGGRPSAAGRARRSDTPVVKSAVSAVARRGRITTTPGPSSSAEALVIARFDKSLASHSLTAEEGPEEKTPEASKKKSSGSPDVGSRRKRNTSSTPVKPPAESVEVPSTSIRKGRNKTEESVIAGESVSLGARRTRNTSGPVKAATSVEVVLHSARKGRNNSSSMVEAAEATTTPSVARKGKAKVSPEEAVASPGTPALRKGRKNRRLVNAEGTPGQENTESSRLAEPVVPASDEMVDSPATESVAQATPQVGHSLITVKAPNFDSDL